jgi:hypothetical protein
MRQDFAKSARHVSKEPNVLSNGNLEPSRKAEKQGGLDPSVQAAGAWFAEHLQQRTAIVVLSDQLTGASEAVRQQLLRAGVQVRRASGWSTGWFWSSENIYLASERVSTAEICMRQKSKQDPLCLSPS